MIHLAVDRTLAPCDGVGAPARGDGDPRPGALAARRRPRHVRPRLPRRRTPPRARTRTARLLVGYVGRLAPEKELELLAHVDRLARCPPGDRRRRTGGAAAARPAARRAFLGVLHGEELSRAYATLDVFVHTGRHETYCQAAQEALASGGPGRRATRRRARSTWSTRVPATSTSPATAPSWRRTSRGSSPTRSLRADGRGHRSRAACRGARGRPSTTASSSTTARSAGVRPGSVGPAERQRLDGLLDGVDEVDVVLHGPPPGQRPQQRPGRQLLGPVVGGRRAPSGPSRTRRRSSSRRRPGRSPARCRPRRAGTRSRRCRPPAGRPRAGRWGSTSRCGWRRGWAARGRSARSGTPSVARPSLVASTTSRAARAHAPMSGRKERYDAHRGDRLVERLLTPAGEERTEVRRLHGARTATGGDRAVAAQPVPEPGGVGVRRRPALERVPAHHADDRPVRRPGGERQVDRVVVQGPREEVVRLGDPHATRRRPVRRWTRGSPRCRRARAGSRASCGRGRPGCRGSAAARRPPARRTPSSSPSANVHPRNSASATERSCSSGPRSRRSSPTSATRTATGRLVRAVGRGPRPW